MRHLVPLLAVPLLVSMGSAAALAQDVPPLVTKAIPMKFVKPSEFVGTITTPKLLLNADNKSPAAQGPLALLPPSIVQLSPDDAAMTLRVRGTAKDIAELRSIIGLLDVRPRAVRLQMRLLRIHFRGEDEAPVVEELATMTTRAINNAPATLTAVGERRVFRMRVQPRINGDDSVTVLLAMQSPDADESVPEKAPPWTYRRVDDGARALLLIGERKGGAPFPDTEWGDLRVPRTGAPTDLYVEVAPTILPLPDVDHKEKKKP